MEEGGIDREEVDFENPRKIEWKTYSNFYIESLIS